MALCKCNGCQARLQIPEAMAGKQVRCPKCKAPFVVAFAPQPDAKPVPKPKPPAPKTEPESDAAQFTLVDNEAVSSKSAAKSAAGPRARKATAHGADAKSTRAKPKASSPPWKLIGILGGSAVLLVVLVVGGILMFASPTPKKGGQLAANDAPKVGKEKQGKKPTPEKAVIDAPADPEPDILGGAIPAAISKDATDRVKRSTVQIRVTSPNGSVGEGSGFGAIEKGLVVTNAHVLGMLHSKDKPRTIDVVVNSGETDETTFKAIVLGADQDHDLALLKLDPESSSAALLPAPLPVDAQSRLTELQKVYIFGFPFGERLGKNITVSESSVSSIRKNKDGSLHQIQVNGGMNPGNSGGPVVDARGAVVGVSVSGIRGTLINFAVPGEKVKGMIQGRVLAANFGEPYKDLDSIRVPFKITCFDPMARVKAMKIDLWTGPPGERPGNTMKRPAPQTGDSAKKTVTLNFLANQAQGDVLLPTIPAGHAVWVQPILQNARGDMTWGHAFILQNATSEPLERRPVNFVLNLGATPERTVDYSSKLIMQMAAGKFKKDKHQKLDTELLEVVKANSDGDFEIRLSAGKTSVNNVDDKEVATPLNPKAIELFKKFAYGLVIAPDGSMKNVITPTFGPPTDEETVADVDDLIGHLTNSYIATCFELPQRKLQPAETWMSTLYMLFGTGKAKQIAEVTFHCTYEGLRSKGDGKEAFIRFEGEVRILQRTHDALQAKIRGHALVDVARGYYSKIYYAVRSDIEQGDILYSEIFEATMTRTPGNPRTLAAAPPATSKKSANPAAAANTVLDKSGTLKAEDPKYKETDRQHHVIPVKLVEGKTYTISLKPTRGSKFSPVIFIEDSEGNVFAETDSSGAKEGEVPEALIEIAGPKSGQYRIIVTCAEPIETTGSYRVRVTVAADAKPADPKEAAEPKQPDQRAVSWGPRSSIGSKLPR